MQEYFEVGQIVNTFGLKGEVKVKPFTDEITRFEDFKKVFIEKKGQLEEIEISSIRYQNTLILVKFKGIDTIEQAEKVKGLFLKIHRKDAKKLEKDTYFIADLIGLKVYTDENELLGKVDDIYSTKSNDIYVIKNEIGKQILLPGIKEVIKDVDFENQKIIVHLLEGLID